MSKIIITVLASLSLVAVPVALATEPGDEGAADARCEQNYWIGYTSTQTVRQRYYDALEDSDPRVNNCEGEHWDGQDTVNDHEGASGSPCLASDGTSASFCQMADPNTNAPSQGNPLLFRVSVSGSEQYASVNIFGVGRAAAYNGACTSGGSLEGHACGGQAATRSGVYLRDNSDQIFGGQNVLAGAVSQAGITKGFPSEADCNQATYEKGAVEDNRTLCGRDNTAITVETLVPSNGADGSQTLLRRILLLP